MPVSTGLIFNVTGFCGMEVDFILLVFVVGVVFESHGTL